jgi:N-acetylmuramoyl-L-alanine amidase
MMGRVQRTTGLVAAVVLTLMASLVLGQGSPPQTPLTLVSREGRRTVATTIVNSQEMIGLDEIASLFRVTVREDTLAGGVTITYRGGTIVVSPDQPMASVNGRVVTLPAPVVRADGSRRWLVPVDFVARALAPIYDARIDLRRLSRLLIVGDVRVPRVVARVDGSSTPTRATIELTPATPITTMTEPGRVRISIEADAIDPALPVFGSGMIEQIRRGDQPTAVVVELSARAAAPRVVPSVTNNVTRIAIEVPSTAPAETAAPPRPAAPTPEPVIPIAARPALQTVVIDPGHGGADTGSRGASGVEEKQVTLEVARRLKAMIETRLGMRVVLTREDDRAMGLDERAAVANNSKADLFLSLHLNSAIESTVAGAEVYYLSLDRDVQDATRDGEPAAVSLPVLGGRNRPIDIVLWDLAQARFVDSSAVLAGMLGEELQMRVAMGRRTIQQAPLRVLTGANMPAALIEMGYLSNREQEKQVQSSDYQASLAESLYSAVARFRDHLQGNRSE